MNIIRFTLSLILLPLFTNLSTPAYAEGVWEKNHPGRTEVNKRIDNQKQLNNKEVKTGEISSEQATQLKKEDHQIREEERLMSGQHNSTLTPQEKAILNQQENHLLKEIKKK